MMLNRSETKKEVSTMKSMIEFKTEKKLGYRQQGVPFEMNPGGYDALIEMNDESQYSLTQNNGGEIDYDQLTSNKKNPTKGLRKINVKTNSSKELDHSFGNDQN